MINEGITEEMILMMLDEWVGVSYQREERTFQAEKIGYTKV